jgi:HAD superfamily hydrolase (TIGR01459 family)
MTASATPIAGLREIADRFDHVLLDQYGTLHDGKTLFPVARDCVLALHAAGKHVLVLSNSGRRAKENGQRLTAFGLPPESYDGVLTSGEIAWSGLNARRFPPFVDLGHTCFLISRGRDRSVIDGLALTLVADMKDADFILLSGLDDEAANLELWRDAFTEAAGRGLPMLCANPDLAMFGAGGLLPAPGALAGFYEQLGGQVAFLGKPHAPIFAAARRQLGDPDPQRILVIGDSLDHDIAGGRAAGMLTLLLTSGVHHGDLTGLSDPAQAVRALAAVDDRMPHWIIEHLAW